MSENQENQNISSEKKIDKLLEPIGKLANYIGTKLTVYLVIVVSLAELELIPNIIVVILVSIAIIIGFINVISCLVFKIHKKCLDYKNSIKKPSIENINQDTKLGG